MRQSAMRHQQQHSRRGGDARERARKQAHQRPNINQYPERFFSRDSGKHAHRSGARAQILAGDAKAKHFGIGADGENRSGQ